MNQADYLAQDATGLADLIKRREVSAGEVLEAAIARMAEVNPKINAVTLDLSDQARAATPADGPLSGVPYLIKDLGAHVAGTSTSGGSRLFQDVVQPADSAIVSAYRKAGLVIFGKTNTPEFGLEPVTEPEAFGPSRNPWNLDNTPGGSSGGASAAVAGGIVPAAHASDGGGSIRCPASCTGLFGLKPSRGRVSFAPANEGWGGFSIQHAVTRSVRDSAALLDAVCKPVAGDPYWMTPPERPYTQEVGRDPGKLRIGFFAGSFSAADIDPECAAAVHAAAKLCESLGHEVVEAKPDADFAGARAAAGQVIAPSIAATLEIEGRRRGRPVELGEVEGLTLALAKQGEGVPASAYIQAIQTAHAFGRAVARYFETYDVLLTSTMGRPPVPVGWLRGGPREQYVDRLFSFMSNTQAFNITGQPAMTVPLAWSQGGLPIGLQFVGRMGDEAGLFRLAGQLEQAAPWGDKRASL
ncbi:Asp-tRNA(Asn)/Glu-tRNA(Gln) amidotransferase A subunit family amidase [Caulobacter ginsengisoli]|uniref:Asp-tRNA(Asn)/Glu-tRNA(Gln) amidotransferase A subunit family amidase n=1 Tax=Caulobacter ginsengisoli TaxID=400775 RepID=A0ABU0IQR2_9CAUL|nr:amidase [Caulobacter ginsengisoli]MDQ0463681.1 Asp-tRNA(Asn)/Glu-tRNA(Gln) amidotransferase A subunit family amidase [Caulobacter ginsengisoli]